MAYSKYQFTTVKELVLQHWVMKNKNFAEEFRSGKEPFYKKAWLLRPVLSFLALVDLILLGTARSFAWLILLICILILSFLLEYPFRLYLLRKAPLFVSLSAWFLYFYDGVLIGLGAAAGLADGSEHPKGKEESHERKSSAIPMRHGKSSHYHFDPKD